MIRLYNTLERQKVAFEPAEAPRVSMYVCGPTTYNLIHIGNARPIVCFDAIRKYLAYRGYEVNYIQNFTDIDDKIIEKARLEGEDPLELAERYIGEYFRDARALGVQEATRYPRVSEHLEDIIGMVRTLEEKELAYEVDGDVYFHVRGFPGYGKLSGRDLEELQAGARVEVGEKKRDPLDFALWKSARPGEPAWESPWGPGRPGWHIECSAMSLRYAGTAFDIHGGGYDLVFPHHENEIAQSEGCTGQPFVRYWLHNGFITVNEEKMSKSLGNFFLVRDVLEQFPGPVIRFFLLSTHYRSPLDFSDQRLREDQKALRKLQAVWDRLGTARPGAPEGAASPEPARWRQRIEEAMDDDFNTALAIGCLFDAARELNQALDAGMDADALAEARRLFRDFAVGILGIVEEEGAPEAAAGGDRTAGLMELILEIREQARKRRDFETADRIRDALADQGIVIEDSRDGARWKADPRDG